MSEQIYWTGPSLTDAEMAEIDEERRLKEVWVVSESGKTWAAFTTRELAEAWMQSRPNKWVCRMFGLPVPLDPA